MKLYKEKYFSDCPVNAILYLIEWVKDYILKFHRIERTKMIYRILADLTILLHLSFILFVLFGGILVLYRRWIFWLHIPSLIWGVAIEIFGWVCPLTPLENSFFHLSGESGYSGGFIEHYIVPLVYPSTLTREMQWGFALVAILLNLMVYAMVLYRRFKGH